VSRNGIGDAGMEALAPLMACPELSHLVAGSNNLNVASGYHLRDGLDRNQLLHLDVGCSFLTDIGVKAMCAVRDGFDFLTHLNVTDNGIAARGVRCLRNALSRNYVLQHIDLSCNQIDDDGAAHVAKLLHRKRDLRHIDVGFNRIGSEGATAILLCAGVRGQVGLQCLNLQNNMIGNSGCATLCGVLPGLSGLRALSIEHNGRTSANVTTRLEAAALSVKLERLNNKVLVFRRNDQSAR
jgi:hypothetical protein